MESFPSIEALANSTRLPKFIQVLNASFNAKQWLRSARLNKKVYGIGLYKMFQALSWTILGLDTLDHSLPML